MSFTGKQKRHLRGLGHALKPVVQIGQQGIDRRVIAATVNALSTHELIKVKLLDSCVADRHEAAEELAAKTGAEVVQVLGRTILLYRPTVENPQISPA
jgi:RNA-binding protein